MNFHLVCERPSEVREIERVKKKYLIKNGEFSEDLNFPFFVKKKLNNPMNVFINTANYF